MSACDLGRQIETGKIDPRELTDSFITAIKEHPFGYSIFMRLTEIRAVAEAEAASQRARSGMRHSLLDGVPISWKDLFDTSGVATEAGSALLSGRVPNKDAEVLRRATELGLVCLGKTHLSEFAFSGLGINPISDTPPCVNDYEAVAGGSSSGAATSVAFGLAAAAVGSDTGGSVRLPAAWNDLVGLKPTHGQLPLDGVVPLCSRLDTLGPLTHNVEDAAALFIIMQGRSQLPHLGQESLASMRFLIADEGLENVRSQPLKGFNKVISELQNAGAELVYGSLPGANQVMPLAACIYEVEAYSQWQDIIDANPQKMFPMIRERFQSGRKYSGLDYVNAWNIVQKIRAEYLALISQFDAVLLPTSPILPPNKEEVLTNPEYYQQENMLALRNTRIGNLMEVPALTLPTGVPSTGLMIFGRPYQELRLLRMGLAIEMVLNRV